MQKTETLGLIFICLIVPGLIFLEFTLFETNCSELGLIEISQEMILLASILFLTKTNRKANKRVFTIFSYFLIILFIRELDFLFDLIVHGFWFWLVILIIIYASYKSFKHKNRLISEILILKESSYLNVLIIGLCILLIFSRLFGTGNLWKLVLNDNYNRLVKTVVQEGIELFAYSLIILSIILIHLESLKRNHSKTHLLPSQDQN